MSEGRHVAILVSLTGDPRERGYLIPVDVLLERELGVANDPDAVRALVSGAEVGFLARDIARQLAPSMAEASAQRMVVPGVVRGGELMAPHLGVYVWLDRGEGHVRVFDQSGRVAWPPSEGEGRA